MLLLKLYPSKVKILLMTCWLFLMLYSSLLYFVGKQVGKKHDTKQDNQQVTKRLNFLVGTSETTCPLSTKYINEKSWNEWLAGLIDGDGSLLVSKPGYVSCEITMGLQDEHALAIIKQKLGGSIKLRSGAKALRYRLHNNSGMLELINRINGNIRHTSRLKQLESVCLRLNVPMIRPNKPTVDNAWFSGFFDAEGTITYSTKNGYPQLTIGVTNKLFIDISNYEKIFNGNIYFDRGQNGYYKWSIQSRDEIAYFKTYLGKHPLRSNKKQRLFLIDEYYYLKDLKAYQALPSTLLSKAWHNFNYKWYKRG